MTVTVIKTNIDGVAFSYNYESFRSAMLNIDLMKKDSSTKFVDVTYFERVYNQASSSTLGL